MMYRCSVCEKEVAEDLTVFVRHTERHIIDIIKKEYPQWVEENGVCRKCEEYYRQQIKGVSLK